MPEMTKYAPGTPCWVDLSTSDLDAAKQFYGAVLGWTDFNVGPAEAGYYTMPERDGKPIAGLATQMDQEKQMGVPPHWNTYVSVTSADQTTKKAAGLGGTVVVEPMDVLDVGRMSVFLDPGGAAVSVWQPKAHIGAGIVNEPGAFCWSELYSNDLDTAQAFYTGLFGWTASKIEGPMDYTMWNVGENPVGGMLKIAPEMGPMPPNWLTYFAVDDTDATVATAKSAGGAAFVEPTDIPPGRFSVLADPQGAMFAVITMAPQT